MKMIRSNPEFANDESIKGPESDLSISFKVSVSNSYGSSSLHLLQEALRSHRYTCLSEFFECLRVSNYQDAYVYWKDVEELHDMIDQLLTKTTELAAQNHYAEEFAANPGGYRTWMHNKPADMQSRYETFLKMVTPTEPE